MTVRKLSRAARPIDDFHVQIGDELLASPDRNIRAFAAGKFEFRMPPQPATGNVEIVDTPHACARVAMDWHYRENLKIAAGAKHVNMPMFADFWKVAKDPRQRSMRVYGRAIEFAESAEGQAKIAEARKIAEAAALAAQARERDRIARAAARAETEAQALAAKRDKIAAQLKEIDDRIDGNTPSPASSPVAAAPAAPAPAEDNAPASGAPAARKNTRKKTGSAKS